MRVAGHTRSRWQVLPIAVAMFIMLQATTVGATAVKPPEPTADGPGAAEYRGDVDGAVTQLAAQLGVSPLAKPPFIELLKTKLVGGGQYAHTWFYGDTGDTCLIQIQPAGQQLDPVDTKFVLTHEVVHCYQNRETGGADVTNWVEEGAATWAAAKIAPGSTIAKEKWGQYLSQPMKSLYSRAYDAIGFFGHLEHVGIDVWPRIVKMMQADSDDAALAVAIADSPHALDDWPTGLARESGFGASWATDGPDIPATKPPRVGKTVANGSSFTVPVAKAANALLELDVKADVFTVDASADAHGRLRDSAGADRLLADVSGRTLCATAQGCMCPDGSPGAGLDLESLAPGEALLGATGGPRSTAVVVRGRSLKDFCAKPAKVDPCLVGTWVSTIVTINVPGADINGTGGAGARFTLAKTGAGSVDLDASNAVEATLPGGLSGSFKLAGTTAGVVNASQGVMTTVATTSANATIEIEIAGLGHETIPLSAGANVAQPFNGTYSCSKTTLVYTAPGFGGQSTWTRS